MARFADFQAMLEQTQLDAVVVATTARRARRCRARRRSRPAATSSARSRWRTSADRARPVVEPRVGVGVNLMVGYIQRFDPLRQRLKQLLDSGAFGDLALRGRQ